MNIEQLKREKFDFTLYFDGAVEPRNPGGHVGYGFYIVDKDDKEVVNGSFYEEEHEHNTNNYAEHMAAFEGMLKLKEILLQQENPKEVKLCVAGDSMLVIKQLVGRWRIKEGYYVGAATHGKKLADELQATAKCVFFKWIPREENYIADDYSIIELVKRGIERKQR